MAYSLDLKDRKILYELDFNSRQSATQISRKIGLSKDSVIYRIEQMKKEGIIKNFYSVIDFGKLGYIGFRIYINLQNATQKKEEEIINFLKNEKMVTFVASTDGRYNLLAVGITKSIYEINALWDKFLQKYVNFFGERLITINIRSTLFSRAYLVNLKKNSFELLTASVSNKIDLDESDRKLVHLISENARMPIIELAEKLDITPKTVIARIKSLRKRGIIVAYRVFIDKEKAGYQLFKVSFILTKVTNEKANSFLKYVHAHPNIICREETLGGDDFEIDIEIENIGKLREIINDIKDKFGDLILDYRILHVYKEHKNLFFHP